MSYQRATELMETILDATYELDRIFRGCDKTTYERWRGYVQAHIEGAVNGVNMFTLESLIEGLDDEDEDQDDEDEDQD